MHLSGPPCPHLQTEGVDEFNPFSSKLLCLYNTEDLLNVKHNISKLWNIYSSNSKADSCILIYELQALSS